MADGYTPRMKQRFQEVVIKAMTEKFGYKNHMEVPKIEKITINMGVGEGSQDKKKVTVAARGADAHLKPFDAIVEQHADPIAAADAG